MASQRALYESISRRGAEGTRAGSAWRPRAVIFALVGIILAAAVASDFLTGGAAQRPTMVDQSHITDTH